MPMQRMRELVDLLNKYALTLIMCWTTPLFADDEYDRLYDELVALETEFGMRYPGLPTLRVGGETLEARSRLTVTGKAIFSRQGKKH